MASVRTVPMPLGELWRSALPQTAFVSPGAPARFDDGAGRLGSIDGITPANRSQRILEARRGFDQTLTAIVKRYDLSDLHEVALVGFSQGSIMALDAAASGRWPVAAVVAFSGLLAAPSRWSAALATPVLLIHGDQDRVIPYTESVQAAKVLQDLGVEAECRILPGVDHTISTEGADIAQRFLAETFGLPAR
jgi:phospholipase/carboxylesterase